jgi:ketosteroid isomerase-like protein
MTKNESLVREFLKMLEQRDPGRTLSEFYHEEAEQIEFPNAITKSTTKRTLPELEEAFNRGSKLLTKEEYEVKNLLSVDDTTVLECTWRGTLAVPVGSIPAGGQMVAHFAQIFEFKDGKIFRQRNYDCFEPFS